MLSTRRPGVRTGCDIQQVEEVSDAIRDFGRRYLDRVYTPAEQDSYRTGGASSLAARFAAKEAVLKLIGRPDGIDLRTVEIRMSEEGRPMVGLSGPAARAAREAALGEIDVSLSHAGGLALAVAVALTGDGHDQHQHDQHQHDQTTTMGDAPA